LEKGKRNMSLANEAYDPTVFHNFMHNIANMRFQPGIAVPMLEISNNGKSRSN